MKATQSATTHLVQVLGRGLLTVLLIVFVTLKLTGVVDWSWLWVFSPIWIPGGIAAILLVGMLLFFTVFGKKRSPDP